MSHVTRRSFLQTSLAATAVGAAAEAWGAAPSEALTYRIAPFRFDVTPPTGHPLCGGWIKPVLDVDDGLEAIGFVLLGPDKPIVICAVDWTGILNGAHLAWRTALAKAAGTTPDRVAVQCVHQHDAPFVCLRAQQHLDEQKAGLPIVDQQFFQDCLNRGDAAIRAAVAKARPVTHIARGEARVVEVAGNRRVALSPEGWVRKMRGSGCVDPELIAMPEGLIDPQLKTVTFCDGDVPLVACRYYATHPMSHYGRGHVSSDFVGLARKRRQQETPGCTQIYFTGDFR
ncbi:MAG: twin-arginine translocation signal domain-containing protein [Pirellulales bacterium]